MTSVLIQAVHVNMKTDKEYIEITNKIIAELVKPKWELQKAYNYYNGKRDAE